MERPDERGFVLITLIVMLVPLMLIAAAFSTAMTGRTHAARTELGRERALLAAESGIDDAIFKGRTGVLLDGDDYTRTLAGDLTFRVEATYLRSDGRDNDGDTDEADEDVFQVIVTGAYRDMERRVAAYLGPVPLLPTIEGALATMNNAVRVELRGTPLLSGHDTNLDGSPGPGPSVFGLAITPPGTVAHLASELDPTEGTFVIGAGATPSLGLSTSFDLGSVVAAVQNTANRVLTSRRYSARTFGTPTAPEITYRDGNLRLSGNGSGAGILVVTGNLVLTGTFRFDGVIVVLGSFENSAGSVEVYGGMIQGPSGAQIDNRGTLGLYYSTQAIAIANSTSGLYVAFNGWQELSR